MPERRCPHCASSELQLVWDKAGLLLWCPSCYRVSDLEPGCDPAGLPHRATRTCRRTVNRSMARHANDAPETRASRMVEHFGDAAQPIVRIMIAAETDSVQRWRQVLELLEPV